VLPEPENRKRVRVEADALGTSSVELEHARQSTTFRADSRLQCQFTEAGKVDVYKETCAMRKWYRG
jgi:hypothetical protein